MDKARYLVELEQLLGDLNEEERQDALEFYDEFITDANLKTRAEIEEKLGSPDQLSQKIIFDYLGRMSKEEDATQEKRHFSFGRLCLWIIAILILGPLVFGIICAILGCLLGLGITVVAVGGSAVLICALAFYTGVWLLWSAPFIGCFYVGLSFVAVGAILVLIPVAIWFVRLVAKWCKNVWNLLVTRVKQMRA